MYSIQYKLMTSLSLVSIAILASLLPYSLFIMIILSSLSSVIGYYVIQNYEIDYKYGFNFIGQLLGLIVIVASFVSVFVVAVNLIK